MSETYLHRVLHHSNFNYIIIGVIWLTSCKHLSEYQQFTEILTNEGGHDSSHFRQLQTQMFEKDHHRHDQLKFVVEVVLVKVKDKLYFYLHFTPGSREGHASIPGYNIPSTLFGPSETNSAI